MLDDVLKDQEPQVARWELYRVLSEPTRLRVLCLCAEEELAIGELAEVLDESQPNASRHVASLRAAGLLRVRKDGTRTLLRLKDGATKDAVVADALASGRALCEAEGSLAKIADVLRARDAVAREFFARGSREKGAAASAASSLLAAPGELGAYLSALAPLIAHRALAVDAGTGDGGLLEVLAPLYQRVVAVDREAAQLERAKERAALRAWDNVELVRGELDSREVRAKILTKDGAHGGGKDGRDGAGADAVFASRLLHHAPSPEKEMEKLAALARPGGVVVVIDYARHEDESMREQADLWLGFEPAELRRFAKKAGLEDARVTAIPASRCGRGPDHHLSWQILVARKRDTKSRNHEHENGEAHG